MMSIVHDYSRRLRRLSQIGQTSLYGVMPFLSWAMISAASSALLVSKSYLLLSVAL
jgi:hypothetical protein